MKHCAIAADAASTCIFSSAKPFSHALHVALVCTCLCAVLYMYYLYTEQRRLDAKVSLVVSQLLSAQRATQAQVEALTKAVTMGGGGMPGMPGMQLLQHQQLGDAAAASLMASLPMLFSTCGGGGPEGTPDLYCSVHTVEDDEDEDEDEEDDEAADVAQHEHMLQIIRAGGEDDTVAEEDTDCVITDESVVAVLQQDPPEPNVAAPAAVETVETPPVETPTTTKTTTTLLATDLSTLKVEDMRTMLRDLGADAKGTKAVLQERLEKLHASPHSAPFVV